EEQSFEIVENEEEEVEASDPEEESGSEYEEEELDDQLFGYSELEENDDEVTPVEFASADHTPHPSDFPENISSTL
ncbi:18331_t:CDS:2, partial [Racocetra fulgida]